MTQIEKQKLLKNINQTENVTRKKLELISTSIGAELVNDGITFKDIRLLKSYYEEILIKCRKSKTNITKQTDLEDLINTIKNQENAE